MTVRISGPLLTTTLAVLSLSACTGVNPAAVNQLPSPVGSAEVTTLPPACETVPDDVRERLIGVGADTRPAAEDLPENSVRSCVWTWSGTAPPRSGPAARTLAVDLTVLRGRETLGTGNERARERLTRHISHERQTTTPQPVPGIGDEAFQWSEGRPNQVLIVFRKNNVIGEIEFTGTDWRDAEIIPMPAPAVGESAVDAARAVVAAL